MSVDFNPADFTPQLVGYTGQGAFRFWCQKVLPIVYDDSLSYYELLNKVVNYLNNTIKDVDTVESNLSEFAEKYAAFVLYLSNLDLSEYVNQKLDEMLEDGTLERLVNSQLYDIDSLNKGFSGFNKGQAVNIMGDSVTITSNMSLTPTYEYTTSNEAAIVSTVIEIPLDFPVARYPFMAGVDDANNLAIINPNLYNPASIEFRVQTPKAEFVESVVKYFISGRRAVAPYYPANQPGLGAEIVAIAKSYWDAKQNGRAFAYGDNFLYTDSDVVNDNAGNAMVECDALVFACLTGVKYENSPWAVTTPGERFDFDDYVVNTAEYSWAIADLKYNQLMDKRITNASTLNWYMWNHGYVFRSIYQLVDGDIALFRRASSRSFDFCGHVGVIKMVGSTPWLYHISIPEYSLGNVVDFCTLADFYTANQGRYDPKDTYFARIAY